MASDKERFLRAAEVFVGFTDETMGESGQAIDMCTDCQFRNNKPEEICMPCPEAWRCLPGHEVEYFREPIHGKSKKQ